MAQLITLASYTDRRGNLTVIEETIPFEIKRIFYIYGVNNVTRGGHRHRVTRQAAICLQGSCIIYNNDGKTEKTYVLDSPDKCLILEPEDWHTMSGFSPDAMLMVIASTLFDSKDYIFAPYDSI